MSWPACSFDMYPIKHVWNAFGRAIDKGDNTPQTLQVLAQDPTEE